MINYQIKTTKGEPITARYCNIYQARTLAQTEANERNQATEFYSPLSNCKETFQPQAKTKN